MADPGDDPADDAGSVGDSGSATDGLRLLHRRDIGGRRRPVAPIESRLDRAALVELYDHPSVEGGYVRTNFVTTLDGAAAGPDGRTGSINTAADREVFALLRSLADVVFVGAGTVRAEGYRAIELEPWQQQLRSDRGLGAAPVLAVLSHSLDLDPALAGGGTNPAAGPVVVITNNAAAPSETLRSNGIEVIVLDVTESDSLAAAAVAALADRGLRRILCEGGARVNRQLLSAGLVHDVCLTLAPTMIGGDLGRIVTGGLLGDGLPCRLEHCLLGADDTMITRWTVGESTSAGWADDDADR